MRSESVGIGVVAAKLAAIILRSELSTEQLIKRSNQENIRMRKTRYLSMKPPTNLYTVSG